MNGLNAIFGGTSDGAYQNLSLVKRFSETVKWIGVNSTFITFADFEEKLHELTGVKKILVYGTEDDEYDVVLSQFIQTSDWIYEDDMAMEGKK